MPDRRQRPIPVTDRERQLLERQRELYRAKIGETGDWGEFLRMAALLGLVALGVYVLAQATPREEQSVSVRCPNCSGEFLMVQPNQFDRYSQVGCPHCKTALVVDLGGAGRSGP